jgi:hypothetical protein
MACVADNSVGGDVGLDRSAEDHLLRATAREAEKNVR